MDKSAPALVKELLASPSQFDQSGRAHLLLQAYFAGYPVRTLQPLLRSKNIFVQRSAAFIASELGTRASALVDDVIPLIDSPDGHTAWYAIEMLTVCCKGQQASKFVHVVRVLEREQGGLRRLAMRMLCNADTSQLDGALRFLKMQHDALASVHAVGLVLLIEEDLDLSKLISVLRGADPLLRLYGAIGIKIREQQHPEFITDLQSSEDPDVSSLASWRRPVRTDES